MSLWADYFKEQENYETIEKEDGFVSYLLNGEECLIAHMYVVPEERGNQHGVALADEVSLHAKEMGCKYLSAAVHANHKSATYNIKNFLKYGFRIVGVNSSHIIIRKDL